MGETGSPAMTDHTSGIEVDWHKQNTYRDYEGLQRVVLTNLDNKNQNGRSRRILGLSIGMFWLVVFLIVLIIVGGIAGGVAGGLASQKKNVSDLSSPITTTSISTSSAAAATIAATTTSGVSSTSASSTTSAATSGPSPIIKSPCTNNPAANGTTLVAKDATGGAGASIQGVGHNFLVLCNTNFPGGAAYGNPNLLDLFQIYVPDMEQCISVCAAYNAGAGVASGAPICRAVAIVSAPGEYCYLKSATGVNNTSSSGGNTIDTAILI